ncbi:snRNA-activating protein complex subunit 1-like [Paramacrobiotus metropolitanus]|uniref:snRNA-activating protein complex subunit 1-like n=1 Tax=Paramacrobiotus metropolitanus TaxID=2943436 RepID=UPI0024461E0A|nr:snRNA-activating protein complex subunit 1-like [Paramacrobiotus metropolitanus]XP_055337326.1 snRNA-activating protein complex subunit 1-like [Paramacrobiotus metropolitanus]XP_055337333.1 snRNA-activating protein complex subunit 1-like [Paramacrobiotus metropolitanus]XP_055337341.1 snRNA-activating protein complex subunit 1-like [Paramacrobiotus metropolitanus]
MPPKSAHKAKHFIPAPPLAIQGFREDMTNLLTAFLAKNSFRFEDFVGLWEEMKFSYIYGGTQTDRGGTAEINEFATKCFREAVVLCSPTNQPLNRTAGLYLLYSLYITRPLYCHTRIRIHPTVEFLPLTEFMNVLLGHEHFDAVFLFLELMDQQAFVFTVTPLEMGYHTQQAKAFRDDASAIHTYVPEIPALLSSSTFTNMLAQDDAYTSAKAELVGKMSNHSQFNSDQLEYTSEFKQKLDHIIQGYKDSAADSTAETNPERQTECAADEADTNDIDAEETVGQRRQRLRREMMKRSVKVRYEI